jgi:hypothetical protein
LQRATLYNSIFVYDEEMLVNQHESYSKVINVISGN